MRLSRTICLILAGIGLVAPVSAGEVLQSSRDVRGLWALSDGPRTLVGSPGGYEVSIELPPGAVLSDLEPTESGWVAAGRLPFGDRGSDLLVLQESPGGADLLPAPQPGPGRYRGQPVLLIEGSRLVGLVWAEGNGHRELEIWAAPWRDGEWGIPERVSPRGPGSQLAPAAAVLEDGSWLVVWAAHDGTDDEIVWSRRQAGVWSKPQRVHSDNDVPDITADLIAIEGGALVAWSWFDGNDYRLRTARLTDDTWTEFEVMGGKGSGGPGLMQTEEGVWLLYQTVEPASWTVLELDRSGIGRRRATVMKETNDRPLLFVSEDQQPRLRWPRFVDRSSVEAEYLLHWQELE